jgi:hypothetical protein
VELEMKNFGEVTENAIEHSLVAEASMILTILAKVIDVFETDRTGGFLTIQAGKVVGIVPFGIIPPEKLEKYHRLSQEKVRRLLADVNANSKNETSYATRNEEMDQWGGAILASNGYLVSFSGLPELADETLSLLYAIYKNWIRPTEALIISNDKPHLAELIGMLDI